MRPSWQIDLKWMLGLTACVLVIAGGVLYSLSELTKRDTAIPMASALVSADINDRVSDAEFAQAQAAASGSPTTSITLSPISLSFPGGDITGMTKEQAAAFVGANVANVMYDNGSAAAKSLIVTPPEGSEKGPVQLGPVDTLTASNHSLFTELFIGLTVAALALLGCVSLLSRGWGRLGAPSFIVAVGTLPLAFAWKFGSGAVGTGNASESIFTHAARESFNSASGDLSTLFLVLAGAAVGTAFLSLLGSALSLAVAGKQPAAEEPAAPAPAPEEPRAGSITVKVRQQPVPELKPGMVPGVPQLAQKEQQQKQQVA